MAPRRTDDLRTKRRATAPLAPRTILDAARELNGAVSTWRQLPLLRVRMPTTTPTVERARTRHPGLGEDDHSPSDGMWNGRGDLIRLGSWNDGGDAWIPDVPTDVPSGLARVPAASWPRLPASHLAGPKPPILGPGNSIPFFESVRRGRVQCGDGPEAERSCRRDVDPGRAVCGVESSQRTKDDRERRNSDKGEVSISYRRCLAKLTDYCLARVTFCFT
jgi:hypothetical protein